MHPDLWTIPGINYTIATYRVTLLLAVLVGILLASFRAKRAGLKPGVVINSGLIGAVLGFVGARGMFILHHLWGLVQSGKIGVTDAILLGGGGEVLGGVVLGVAGTLLYLRVRKHHVLIYVDVVAPSLVLAMAIGRIGCLAFGCCWGDVCQHQDGSKSLAWAVRFPYGSPAYVRHCQNERVTCPVELEWVAPDTKEFEPIPREVLYNDEVCRCANAYSYANFLQKIDENDPQIEGLLAEVRELAPKLKRQRLVPFASALAVHLDQMTTQRKVEEPYTTDYLRGIAAKQHSAWVHPTQVYAMITLFLLFVILSAVWYRRRQPGMVTAWLLILYPINRYVMEVLRGDNPHDVGGFTVSQFISIVALLGGIVMMLVLRSRPIPDAAGPASGSSPLPATDHAAPTEPSA